MGEGRSVWIVEHGEYSDYKVDGIYSTRENAERVAAKLKEGGDLWYAVNVTERELDPGIDALNQGLDRFDVSMRRDGTVQRVAKMTQPWEPGPEYKGYVRRRQGVLVVEVWARDEKHAIKIANEKRVQMIASGEWEEKDER